MSARSRNNLGSLDSQIFRNPAQNKENQTICSSFTTQHFGMGIRGEGVSFSVEDKLLIIEALDQLGVHYIEGGYPGL